MKLLKKQRLAIVLEVLLLAGIISLGAWIRLSHVKSVDIYDFQPDEPRIALGSATILHYKTPIFCFESSHEPPLSLYLPIPFFLIFGWKLWVIKLAIVFYSLAAVVFIYLFGREYFSWRVGAVAALTAAWLPFFVRYSTIMVEHSFLPFFAACVFYGYARHLKTGNIRPLCLSLFTMGLGLSTKIVFLYFITAFFCALFFSGEFRKIRISKRQIPVLFAWFLAGVSPFLAFVALNQSFVSILAWAAGGGGMGHSIGYFASAVCFRLREIEDTYTPIIRCAIAAWLSIFVVEKKIYDSRPVFLFVLCVAVIAQSTVTISGMHQEQMLVILPAVIVFIASIVDIPARFSPVFSGGVACAILLLLLLLIFGVRYTECPSYGVWENITMMREPLEAMDSRKTISAQKDITMMHRYLDFMKTGLPPDYRVQQIVSLSCNRFRNCFDHGSSIYMDVLGFYLEKLHDRTIMPDDICRSEFYTGQRQKILEATLVELFKEQRYKYLLIGIYPSDQKFTALNNATLDAMEKLKGKGLINWRSKEYMKNRQRGFVVLEILKDPSPRK